jgi:opacity protein-like surface antigen
MKNVVAPVVLLALMSIPAFAADGNVPQATLSSLGLSGLETMSDAQGMDIRGQSSSFAIVKGTSLVFGQLMTPDTKNFVVGSSANEVDGNAETTAAGGMLTVSKNHSVSMVLSLDVGLPDLTSFIGSIGAAAGGVGSASALQP